MFNMKVLLINGSHNEFGCTDTALDIIYKKLLEEGIETKIIWIGKAAVKDFNCEFKADDIVNVIGKKLKKADGLIVSGTSLV